MTRIYFSLPLEGRVILRLYNMLGEGIKTLVDEIKPAGNYWVEVNGNQLHSGVYIYQMIMDNFSKTKKMILMK